MKRLPTVLLLLVPAALLALEVPRPGERSRPANPLSTSAKHPKASSPESSPSPTPSAPFQENPAGAGLEVLGLDEPLTPYSILTFSFPSPMSEAADDLAQECPVVFEPPLDAQFRWRSATTGELRVVGPIIPGTQYRLRLRNGLKDLAGSPLPTEAWGARMSSPPFALEWSSAAPSHRLSALPQVYLAFNYPADLRSAADGIFFRDRHTGQKVAAEVFLNRADGPVSETREVRDPKPIRARGFRVRPREPLPLQARVDLVVDGVRDAFGEKTLPYPIVLPLGKTRPLAIENVAAKAHPLEPRKIVVTFDEALADAKLPSGAVTISPPVSGLKMRAEGREIILEGPFEAPGRYVVHISREITGASGYSLAKDERWGATFREPRPAIIFPSRELRMRSAAGLRFAFYQVACGAGTWSLSKIPAALLPEIRRRLREFDREMRDSEGRRVWTAEGLLAQPATTPLDELPGLERVATGDFPAATGEEMREITWQGQGLDGPMLLEVKAACSDGRIAGNRAILYFGDLAITRKESRPADVLRVVSLASGEPQPGARVRLLDAQGEELASSKTDREGLATFDPALFAGCEYFEVSAGNKTAFQPRDLAALFPGATTYFPPAPRLRSFTWTDRPLYRPGQMIRFKGFLRVKGAEGLQVPREMKLRWTLGDFQGTNPLASGNATVDREGGWEGAWTIPEDAASGDSWLRIWQGDSPIPGEPVLVRIEEFRNPPFSVECEPLTPPSPALSEIAISSRLFHGPPNRGARVQWRAVWSDISRQAAWEEMPGPTWRMDAFSEGVKEPNWTAETSGESVLDENGQAKIRCAAPFPDPGNRSWCFVGWRVDITGPDGQTVTGGAQQKVAMEPVLYGIRSVDAREGILTFAWDALEPFSRRDVPTAEIFKVETRSVKERLSPGVYRFQNSDLFTSKGKIPLAEPGTFDFQVSEPGKYVAVLSPPAGKPGIRVSAEAWLPGPGEAPLPVEAETQLLVKSLGADAQGHKTWQVGEKAVLEIHAPTAGIAWVSVETDRILHSFTMPLEGNLARLEIPILPEYEPNAFVSVYLVRPEGAAGLAGEMFGCAQIQVESPGRALEVQVQPENLKVGPREEIRGRVLVQALGKPIAGADLTIYAVDDSLLQLGGWKLPSGFQEAFFPPRSHGVRTYSALEGLVEGIEKSWLTSKGYLVGDGGEEALASVSFERNNFQPVILWRTNVKTDAAGQANFSAQAADDLTRYRIVAVAQTRTSQFGAGDALVEVSKPLTVEPALPRFLRAGDEVELRALVRQETDLPSQAEVSVRVEGQATCAEQSASLEIAGRAPSASSFPAIAGESPGSFTAHFTARTKNAADAVAITLPVLPATTTVVETLSGTWSGEFAKPQIPPSWQKHARDFSLTVSTSPWLVFLQGLPMLTNYPHGCFEQKSAKILALTALRPLADFLPEPEMSEQQSATIIRAVLGEYERALLPNGLMPYWPDSSVSSVATTIQCAWSMLAAEQQGIPIPPRLAEILPASLEGIAKGEVAGASPDLRAQALFVLSRFQASGELNNLADSLYRQRDQLGEEGRLFLALAFAGRQERIEAIKTLVADHSLSTREFDPNTFSSPTRTQALRFLAESLAGSAQAPEALREWLAKAASLSTQENLWLLIAAQQQVASERSPALPQSGLIPEPAARSKNRTAALWKSNVTPRGFPTLRENGSWVMQAKIPLPADSPPVDQGMRLERILVNLTNSERDGSPGRPFALGDEIAIYYRFFSGQPRAFVALTEPLPAAFEASHPQRRQPPPNPQAPQAASLSHAEIGKDQVSLFFDRLPQGSSAAALLVRVTAQGTFAWPQATLTPMYQPLVFAQTAAMRLKTAP